MNEDLDRLTATFSAAIQERSRQLQEKIGGFSAALERFADRLSAVIADVTASVSTTPGGAAAPTAGVQLVRVVNDQSQPIPVRAVGGGGEERRGGGGFFSSLLGGIGAFLGGIFGGFAAPFTGVIVGAELVAALAEAIPLVIQARRLVADVRAFARELVTGVRGLVLLLFNELHRAGIFPVSRLIASLLILIDTGIRLVLSYIQPLLTWVSRLLQTLLTWLGEFINRLSAWLQGVLNALPVFLRDLIGYLIETALRPALRLIIENDIRPAVGLMVKDAIRALVEGLTTVFVGFLAGLGTVILETLAWGADWIAYAIVKALNVLPFVDIDVAAPRPLGDRLSQGIKEAFAGSRELGRVLAEALLGPAPTGGTPATAPAGPAAGPTVAPRLRLPGFRAPELQLPEVPTPEPALERILERTERPPGRPEGAVPTPAPTPAATAGITLNGGIQVQVYAQTIDRDNAEATARMLADQLLEELTRLTELERFRRGLPTGAIA
ncbi:MAG: hypothetical protein ACRERE_12505 [Candidatus Entotheonellia bacterium]